MKDYTTAYAKKLYCALVGASVHTGTKAPDWIKFLTSFICKN